MLSLFFLMIAFFYFFNIQNNGVWTLDPNFVQIKKVLRSIIYLLKKVLRYSVWPAKVIRTLWRERERWRLGFWICRNMKELGTYAPYSLPTILENGGTLSLSLSLIIATSCLHYHNSYYFLNKLVSILNFPITLLNYD